MLTRLRNDATTFADKQNGEAVIQLKGLLNADVSGMQRPTDAARLGQRVAVILKALVGLREKDIQRARAAAKYILAMANGVEVTGRETATAVTQKMVSQSIAVKASCMRHDTPSSF